MEISLVLTVGLLISLPLMWMNNRKRKVATDRVIVWLMLAAVLIIGGASIWAQDLVATNQLNTLRSGSYLAIYAVYWIVVVLRRRSDRQNIAVAVSAAIVGIVAMALLSLALG